MLCADDTEDSRTLPSGAAESTRVGAAVPTDTSHCRLPGGPIAAVCAVFWNDVAVQGCWFHFARALVKSIRILGLSDAYQNDSHTHDRFPVSLVSSAAASWWHYMPAFDEVSSLLDDQLPSKSLMQQLIRYVSQQWLNKSTIGLSRLSVRDSPSRINDAVEFSRSASSWIKVSYPNLFAFLWHLQQTTVDIQADVNRVSRGTAVRCAKKCVNLINDARIKVCTQRFDSHVLLCVAGDEYYLCSRKKYLYFVFGDLTYFHVGLPYRSLLHFPFPWFTPALSTPAFSTPAIYFHIFHSRIFYPCIFTVSHFPLLYFQSPLYNTVTVLTAAL